MFPTKESVELWLSKGEKPFCEPKNHFLRKIARLGEWEKPKVQLFSHSFILIPFERNSMETKCKFTILWMELFPGWWLKIMYSVRRASWNVCCEFSFHLYRTCGGSWRWNWHFGANAIFFRLVIKSKFRISTTAERARRIRHFYMAFAFFAWPQLFGTGGGRWRWISAFVSTLLFERKHRMSLTRVTHWKMKYTNAQSNFPYRCGFLLTWWRGDAMTKISNYGWSIECECDENFELVH